jgi:hypothetical protein
MADDKNAAASAAAAGNGEGATEKKAKAAKSEQDVVEPRPAPVPLAEDRWKLKEHMNPGGWICVPHLTTVEDLHQPVFWANVARHLRPSSTVEIHWDDGSQFAEVYVLSAGRNWASISLLRHRTLEKPLLPQQAHQYGIAYNGPVDKYRVSRLNDNAVIRAGFASEGDARKFLDEYVRKLAA